MTYAFIFKDSFMDLTKTHIRETQTDEEVLLHPKWSFPIGKYTLAFKTITISNGEEVMLTAYKISSIYKNILGIYDYKVHVHHTMDLPFVVWGAVFKGIHLLLRH
jgi:hypothetical protein